MGMIVIRWPQEGEYVQHEIDCMVPRQSDVLCVEGTWVRVSNVMIYPQLVVYAHRLAVEDDEQRALEIQFGLSRERCKWSAEYWLPHRRKRVPLDDSIERLLIAMDRPDWAAALLGELPQQLRDDIAMVLTHLIGEKS